jgi:hypothetical protein
MELDAAREHGVDLEPPSRRNRGRGQRQQSGFAARLSPLVSTQLGSLAMLFMFQSDDRIGLDLDESGVIDQA